MGRQIELDGGQDVGIAPNAERFPQEIAMHDQQPAGTFAAQAGRIRDRDEIVEMHLVFEAEFAGAAQYVIDGSGLIDEVVGGTQREKGTSGT